LKNVILVHAKKIVPPERFNEVERTVDQYFEVTKQVQTQSKSVTDPAQAEQLKQMARQAWHELTVAGGPNVAKLVKTLIAKATQKKHSKQAPQGVAELAQGETAPGASQIPQMRQAVERLEDGPPPANLKRKAEDGTVGAAVEPSPKKPRGPGRAKSGDENGEPAAKKPPRKTGGKSKMTALEKLEAQQAKLKAQIEAAKKAAEQAPMEEPDAQDKAATPAPASKQRGTARAKGTPKPPTTAGAGRGKPAGDREQEGGIENVLDVTLAGGVDVGAEVQGMQDELENLRNSTEEQLARERAIEQMKQEELILDFEVLSQKVQGIVKRKGLNENVDVEVLRCLSYAAEWRLRGLLHAMIRYSQHRLELGRSHYKTEETSNNRRLVSAIEKRERDRHEQQAEEKRKALLADAKKRKKTEDEELQKLRDEAKLQEEERIRASKTNAVALAATGAVNYSARWAAMLAKPKADPKAKTSGAGGAQASEAAANNATAGNEDVGAKLSAAQGAQRTITLRDCLAFLERDPPTSKSQLLYKVYANAYRFYPN